MDTQHYYQPDFIHSSHTSSSNHYRTHKDTSSHPSEKNKKHDSSQRTSKSSFHSTRSSYTPHFHDSSLKFNLNAYSNSTKNTHTQKHLQTKSEYASYPNSQRSLNQSSEYYPSRAQSTLNYNQQNLSSSTSASSSAASAPSHNYPVDKSLPDPRPPPKSHPAQIHSKRAFSNLSKVKFIRVNPIPCSTSFVTLSCIDTRDSESDIQKLLSGFGELIYVQLKYHPNTGQSLGIARAKFLHPTSSVQAITHLNGKRSRNNECLFVEADPSGKIK
ncbi:hypothetical protein HMI55_001442 [Coelomomyces lativittatus]|nr:hypothetical protein HMI56_002259 [Coelomomyces lativittatus]KAJ1505811.1 hypothetical protein HMI55_001442 [Coelomomyces lativittatus]